jgi:hypothetical protein
MNTWLNRLARKISVVIYSIASVEPKESVNCHYELTHLGRARFNKFGYVCLNSTFFVVVTHFLFVLSWSLLINLND